MLRWSSKLKEFSRRKDRPVTQFIKYLFCGGLTFVVDVVVFYLFAWLIFPSLRISDPFGSVVGWGGFSLKEVPEAVLIRNYYINKVICFLCSNTVAYISNVLFVFNDGRHSRTKEVFLFYLFSTVSFVSFTGVSGVLIGHFKWDVTYSYFLVFAMAMVVNFTVRKRFVFKG